MKLYMAVYLLVFPLAAGPAGKVDVSKLRKDGWRRDSHVIGVGKEPDYLLFKKGKEELKCYLHKECGRALYECIEYCGQRPRPERKVEPQIEQIPKQRKLAEADPLDPDLRQIIGDEAPSRDPPPMRKNNGRKPETEVQKETTKPDPVLNRANSLFEKFAGACYLDRETTLGDFKGVAFGKYAVFLRKDALFTCEIDRSDRCYRLLSERKEFFLPCLKVGSCIRNFRKGEDTVRHCMTR